MLQEEHGVVTFVPPSLQPLSQRTSGVQSRQEIEYMHKKGQRPKVKGQRWYPVPQRVPFFFSYEKIIFRLETRYEGKEESYTRTFPPVQLLLDHECGIPCQVWRQTAFCSRDPKVPANRWEVIGQRNIHCTCIHWNCHWRKKIPSEQT